jgi:hypothetical protein
LCGNICSISYGRELNTGKNGTVLAPRQHKAAGFVIT